MTIQPVNPNATPEARAVLEYLHSIRGSGIILGQHTLSMEQQELWKIREVTGKLPALCGFELLSYSPNVRWETCDEAALAELRANTGTLVRAYEWAERGGLITFTWHWYSPIGGRDKSFYTRNTDFDAEKVLQAGTPEREAFYRDMDVMAGILRGFQEKHIPILWRPFHESEGGWFWWGARGMDVARKLYREMFHYYTEVKHLDHLIWVWNNPAPEGYVGDEYCDIISGDWYVKPHEHTAMKPQYESLSGLTPNKPLAMGEVGMLPDLDEIRDEKLDWLWFMIWGGPFVLEERFNTCDFYRTQYHHPYAITLDKLPKLY